jgi:glycosyltransferase involved in cell wall biosynthesis
MGVYNGMPYLPQAVRSILSQSYRNFEFIVVDDGSTDDTPLLLKSIDDDRLRYVRQCNSGHSIALNNGLKLARAPLIARMDGDDISLHNRLAVQKSMFDAKPNLAIASTHYNLIDANDNVIKTIHDATSDAACRFRLAFTPAGLHPGFMFRRRFAESAGLYDTSLLYAEDYDFWVRLSKHGEIGNCPEVLLNYRSHPGQISVRKSHLQVSEASSIAGRYVAGIVNCIPEVIWRDLRNFYVGMTDEISERINISGIYFLLSRAFITKFGASPELTDQIKLHKQKLRWKCLKKARSVLPDVFLSVRFLYHAMRLRF